MSNLPLKEKKTRKVKTKVWEIARSLKPGTWLSWAMAQKQHAEEFVALLDAWKFAEPVRPATQDEIDRANTDVF